MVLNAAATSSSIAPTNAKMSIVTEGLTKSFDGRVAVDGLNLAINTGEVFGFLGPNGAGKTTTVRMLCALIGPTDGHARISGHDVVDQASDVRARVGLLTESPGLYEHLSAWQNLMFYARLYRLDPTEAEAQVKRYLHLMGLWERRDDRVGAFSKGMKQKVALSRALIHRPAVVFLDEPTSGLDPEGAKLVRDFIAEMRGEGRTIFLCTHNLDEAERLCDRVAIFNRRVIRLDSPDRLRYSLYGRQVEVAIANPAISDRLIDALHGQVGVVTWDAANSRLVIGVTDPDAETPSLVNTLVAAGAQVRRVAEIEHSLESVYLDLIKEAEGMAA